MTVVWTLPWAALSVVQFDPDLAPSLFSSDTVFWALPLFGLDWVLAPLLLLVAIDPTRHDRGARWHTAWTATVAVGSGYEVAAFLFGHLMSDEPDDLARWHALAAGGGFVLLAMVTVVVLAGSPRDVLSVGRAVVAKATLTR